jgi:RNase P subunit RPR2
MPHHDILSRAGIVLQRTTDGEHRTTCPRCSHQRRKKREACLAVRVDADGVTWFCHHCGWSAGLRTREIRVAPRPKSGDTKENFALQLWHEARPLAGSLAETYLRSRRLQGHDVGALRFHPNCPRGPRERLPAMLALFTDIVTAAPCGIHRTFLTPDGSGKDATGPAKMMLGRAQLAAIRLVPDDAVTYRLAICEGIETGLTLLRLGQPIWALGSAGAIAAFPRLAGIECLTIFADHDEAGLRAALTCKRRLERDDFEVNIICPNGPDTDFNDLLKGLPPK